MIQISIAGDEPDDAELDAPHIYEQITDLRSLADRLLTFQESYNESIRGAGMDLVFFKVSAFVTFYQLLFILLKFNFTRKYFKQILCII